MRVWQDEFNDRDKAKGVSIAVAMLTLAAISGGLTWAGFPDEWGKATTGTRLGVGVGAILTVLFLVLLGAAVFSLIGQLGVRRIGARLELDGTRAAWRVEFDTDADIGTVEAKLVVTQEVHECRMVKHRIERPRGPKRERDERDWTGGAPKILFERGLCKIPLPSTKVLEGSFTLDRALPHPRDVEAWTPGKGEPTRESALLGFAEDDAVGRSAFEGVSRRVASDGSDVVGVRMRILWRVDLFAERRRWPDAAVTLQLRGS